MEHTSVEAAAKQFALEVAALGLPGIRLEYSQLRSYVSADSAKTAFEENKSKNRYRDVYCLDVSRVILKFPLGESSDYIHANWVTADILETPFICAQGPLANTTFDFWRMIWQEKVAHIFMLCRCEEGGKSKCIQYWPKQEGASVDVHGFQVKNEKVSTSDKDFCVTSLVVTYRGQVRHIEHRQWVTWPDKTVPRTIDTGFKLMEIVRGRKTPTLIHCSAGIGRTGTLVAMELIYRNLMAKKVPKLKGIIENLRNQRSGAVQTEDQYAYVIYVTLQYFAAKGIIDYPLVRNFSNEYEQYVKHLSGEVQIPLIRLPQIVPPGYQPLAKRSGSKTTTAAGGAPKKGNTRRGNTKRSTNATVKRNSGATKRTADDPKNQGPPNTTDDTPPDDKKTSTSRESTQGKKLSKEAITKPVGSGLKTLIQRAQAVKNISSTPRTLKCTSKETVHKPERRSAECAIDTKLKEKIQGTKPKASSASVSKETVVHPLPFSPYLLPSPATTCLCITTSPPPSPGSDKVDSSVAGTQSLSESAAKNTPVMDPSLEQPTQSERSLTLAPVCDTITERMEPTENGASCKAPVSSASLSSSSTDVKSEMTQISIIPSVRSDREPAGTQKAEEGVSATLAPEKSITPDTETSEEKKTVEEVPLPSQPVHKPHAPDSPKDRSIFLEQNLQRQAQKETFCMERPYCSTDSKQSDSDVDPLLRESTDKEGNYKQSAEITPFNHYVRAKQHSSPCPPSPRAPQSPRRQPEVVPKKKFSYTPSRKYRVVVAGHNPAKK